MGDGQESVEPGEIKREGANVTIGAPVAVATSALPFDSELKPDEKED